MIFFVRLIFKSITKSKANQFFSQINLKTINCLNGIDFEKLLELLFEIMDFNVKCTPTTCDYGGDLIISNKTFSAVIQAKLYFKNLTGNKSVQEVYAAKEYYKADYAIVITNSTFTKPAINLATSNNVTLIDGQKLIELCHLPQKKRLEYFNKLLIVK